MNKSNNLLLTIALSVFVAGVALSQGNKNGVSASEKAELAQLQLMWDSGDYLPARELAQRLLENLESDLKPTQYTFELLALMGKIEYTAGYYREAINHLKTALSHGDKLSKKMTLEKLDVLNHIAFAEFERGHSIRAKELADSILPLALKFPNSTQLADVYETMAYYYGETGDLETTEELFLKSHEINEKNATDFPIDFARSLSSVATIKIYRKNPQAALKDYETSLQILKEHHAPKIRLASNYRRIGSIYYELQNKDLAMNYCLLAKEIYEENLPKWNPSYISLLNSLGGMLREQAEFEKADSVFLMALTIMEENSEHVSKGDAAQTLINRGKLKVDMQQYEEAAKLYEQAAKALEEAETYSAVAIYLRMNLQHSLASLYYYLGDYQSMVNKHLENIEAIKKNVSPKSPLLADSYNNISFAYQLTGEYEKSLNACENGLEILNFDKQRSNPFEGTINPYSASVLVWNKADTYSYIYQETGKAEHLTNASNEYKQYLNFIDFSRSNYRDESTILSFVADNYVAYDRVLTTSIKLKKLKGETPSEDLFNFAEQGRALVISSAFQAGSDIKFAGISTSVQQREVELKNELKSIESKYSNELSKSDNEKIKQQLNAELLTKKRAYSQFLDSLKTFHPDYYKLKYDLSIISVKEVQQHLLSPRQTLLEYFVGDSSIFLFVIKKDLYHVEEIKKDFPLEAWVDSLRALISQTSILPQPYVELASTLYDKLLRPVEPMLMDTSLIVIPDGALCYLPFDALLTEHVQNARRYDDLPYLLHKKAISYCYSATLLQLMQEKTHRQPPARELIAFAPWATDATGDTTGRRGTPGTHPDNLDSLAYSRVETEYVAKITGGDALFNEEATKENFLEMAYQYRILFFSMHGWANATSGDDSWLAFYNLHKGLDSTLLYVRELYNLQLNADLAYLSACETSMGEMQRGEGIIGLARAFSYAGAKSIVSSLWPADDYAASELSRQFFWHLKEGKLPKDMALRQAKLDYLANNARTGQPFYWAALIPVGDMSALW